MVNDINDVLVVKLQLKLSLKFMELLIVKRQFLVINKDEFILHYIVNQSIKLKFVIHRAKYILMIVLFLIF